MNICGVLVHCLPGKMAEVCQALEQLAGVEVHSTHEEQRCIIVTVEDTKEAYADQQVLAVHRLENVVSAALTYHHFEPESTPGSVAA